MQEAHVTHANPPAHHERKPNLPICSSLLAADPSGVVGPCVLGPWGARTHSPAQTGRLR